MRFDSIVVARARSSRAKGLFAAAVLLAVTVVGLAGCRPEVDCKCNRCAGGGTCVTYEDLIAYQKEAQTNLRAIFTTQVAYYGENSTYGTRFADLGWSPWPPMEIRYAYIIDGDSIQPEVGGPYHSPWITAGHTRTSFTAIAVSNIDCDPILDVWTINDAGVLNNPINDVSQ